MSGATGNTCRRENSVDFSSGQTRTGFVRFEPGMHAIYRLDLFSLNILRYGKFWAPWRLTGPENPDAKTHNIELGKDESGNQEGIASASGIYRSPDKEGKDTNMAGWIENLTLVTTWDKRHGPYGDELTPLMRTNRWDVYSLQQKN